MGFSLGSVKYQVGGADRERWNKNKAKSKNGGIQESGRGFFFGCHDEVIFQCTRNNLEI